MRLFAITLVIAQLTVSLLLVGWILARSGLLREPLVIIGTALVLLSIAAVAVRIGANGKQKSKHILTEENR